VHIALFSIGKDTVLKQISTSPFLRDQEHVFSSQIILLTCHWNWWKFISVSV